METWGFGLAMRFLQRCLRGVSICLITIKRLLKSFFEFLCFFFIDFFFIFSCAFGFSFFLNLAFYFLKLVFLIFFFFFNIFTFFFFFDCQDLLLSYLNLFFISLKTNVINDFLKVLFIFFFDLFSFLKTIFFTLVNPKNILAFFYYSFQFFEFFFYEIFRQFFEQNQHLELFYYNNWMPRYLFGDGLSKVIRFNKFVNLFDFSGLIKEKNFIYRRVGLVNSRFWLFRSYLCDREIDSIVQFQVGKLVQPDRWFLDFRSFSLFDYLNPWNYFEYNEFSKNMGAKREIQIELLHNYHAIMESPHLLPYNRIYYDYFISTFFFFELTIFIMLLLWLITFVDDHFQEFNIREELTEDVTEELDSHTPPFYIQNPLNENFESKMFASFPYDFLDYSTDENLSWDSLLGQPYTLRYNLPVSIDNFEVLKQQNFLFDEFKSFSFLLPLYRLVYKLSMLKFFNLYFLKDLEKFFQAIFYLCCYIPLGICILIFKCVINALGLFLNLHFFFRFFIFLLLNILICTFFFFNA